MSIHRFETMLYAKLIWLLFAHRIYIELQTNVWNQVILYSTEEKQISLLKLSKLFYLQQSDKLLEAIQKNEYLKCQKVLEETQSTALQYMRLQTKNTHKSSFDIIINP